MCVCLCVSEKEYVFVSVRARARVCVCVCVSACVEQARVHGGLRISVCTLRSCKGARSCMYV